MKRKERTRILVHSSNEFLTQWAQYFEQQTQFHVIEEPKNALTMLRMRESAQHSLFYLGEVLVSETRVKCRDTIGIGLIQGNELEKSYALAVIDAACNAPLDGVDQLEKALTQEKQKQDAAHARHVAGTAVYAAGCGYQLSCCGGGTADRQHRQTDLLSKLFAGNRSTCHCDREA